MGQQNKKNNILYKTVIIQVALVIAFSMMMTFVSPKAATSALAGGGISIITGLVMIVVLRSKPGDSAGQYFGRLVIAEILKFILVIALIAITIMFLPVLPAFVILGFLVALLSYWVVLGLNINNF